MSKEMDFFVYLLESYADHKGRLSRDVLREWESHGIAQEIFGDYWGYHTERIENAFADIDSLLATGKHVVFD